MKILIIHPEDKSTDFLSAIYKHNITDTTIVKGGISKNEVKRLIIEHDRIIMLGHGSPLGLFNVGKFTDTKAYIIDEEMVPYLKNKENICIWCNANQFVNKHKLNAFYTGMFISEVSEADYCNVITSQEAVTESNNYFAELVGEIVNESLVDIFNYTDYNYGLLAEISSVAEYNHNRLYLETKNPIQLTLF